MKKYLLSVILLVGAVGAVGAVEVTVATAGLMREPTTATSEASQSTDTVVGISISSQTPTSMVVAVGSTTAQYTLLANVIRSVAVQNVDGAACNLFCSENVNVSSNPASGHAGFKIRPNDYPPPQFPIVPGTNFYCLNDTATRPCWATVFRRR